MFYTSKRSRCMHAESWATAILFCAQTLLRHNLTYTRKSFLLDWTTVRIFTKMPMQQMPTTVVVRCLRFLHRQIAHGNEPLRRNLMLKRSWLFHKIPDKCCKSFRGIIHFFGGSHSQGDQKNEKKSSNFAKSGPKRPKWPFWVRVKQRIHSPFPWMPFPLNFC